MRWSALCFLLLLGVAAIFSGQSTGEAAAPKPPSGAAPAQPQALNMNYGFFMALTGNNDDVRNMGFQWVQYGVYWSESEPSEGNYQWGNLDNIVNAAVDTGQNILIRLSRSPLWAISEGCPNRNVSNSTCPPNDPVDFGRFAGAAAERARSILAGRGSGIKIAYEIWNEPNTDQEWGGMCPNPAKYTAMLATAYPAIKGEDPSALVLGGSVTTVGIRARPDCVMDDLTFLEGMYNAGAKPYFDILADHPYGFGAPPETDPINSNKLVFRRAERHREVMLQYGDAAKKVWATEMGWPVDPTLYGCQRPDWYFTLTPQQQADYLVRAFNYARSYWPWMTGMFVFTFDFNEAPWYNECDAFRFWAVKGREAQIALANFVQNPPATYTPIPASPTPVPDLPPVIAAVRYSATQFSRYGGTLTVEVDANDPDSSPIDVVQANVYFPGGAYQQFNFDLVLGNAQQGTWRTSIPIAENNSGQAQVYSVQPFAVETYPGRRVSIAPWQQITAHETRFIDVPTNFWAYEFIEGLAAQGAVSGYGDNTFKPGNPTTRAQLTKITMLGFGYPLVNDNDQSFADVPPGSPFHIYVETAARRSIIGGYPCGRPGEACDDDSRPYFRPNNSVTRGQITKIVVLSAGWSELNNRPQTFADVPPGSTFFGFVESANERAIVGGYPCGGPGEPCDTGNRPYFRPGATTTRAQISKMVWLALPHPTATATPTPTTAARPAKP